MNEELTIHEEAHYFLDVTAARMWLKEAEAIADVQELRDKVQALAVYQRKRNAGKDAARSAAKVVLYSERRLGELTKEIPKIAPKMSGRMKGGPAAGPPEGKQAALKQEGIRKQDASRYEALAAIPEDKLDAIVEEQVEAGKLPTTRSVLRQVKRPHVAHNSGENEWYTPPECIEAARRVMGEIDLDPASSARANEVVKAHRYYSLDDDGLSQQWCGRVWMNPPYAAGIVDQFVDKLYAEFSTGRVEEFIVLVNNATETRWFETLAVMATLIAFPRSRVRFWRDGETASPLQGQAFVYAGPKPAHFFREFAERALIGAPWAP